MDKKSVGPAYLDVANRYKGNAEEQARIAKKIITGGAGVWGDHAMSAHPSISEGDANLMVKYIVGLAAAKSAATTISSAGTFKEVVPEGDNGRGGYLLRVAYKDKGAPQIAALSAEKIIALRNPGLDPEKADFSAHTQLMITPSRSFNIISDNGYIGYRQLDFTGIQGIEFMVQASPRSGAVGGVIEVHLDSPTGKLIGQTDEIVPMQMDFQTAMAKLAAQNPKAKKPTGPPSAAGIDFNALRKIMSIVKVAKIEPTTGEHDVYIVFRNPKAQPGQILVQVVQSTFVGN